MPIFESGLITKDDLLSIENILYKPREQELIGRQICAPNNSYPSYAREVGYDYYDRRGSAIILAKGAGAKDVPMVGEVGGRVTQNVYTIASGIGIERAELEAIQAKKALGKGPAVQLDTVRIDAARRYIYETFNKIIFAGFSAFGIKGIFDSSFYGPGKGTKEDVAQGAFSGSAAAKRLWENKTPQEIIADLNAGLAKIEVDGLFTGKVLIIPPSAMTRLRKPYSDQNPMTTLSWIQSEGQYFEKIYTSKVMAKTFNGDTTDWFMILDNDPEVIQHVITNDIFIGPQVEDIVGKMEMAAMMDTAGVIIRHPAALYIGKGIG